MDRQEKTSIKIAAAFVIPFGVISSILNFILFKYGPLNEMDGFLSGSLYDFSNGELKWGFISLIFSLLIGCVLIIFLAWIFRYLSKRSLNPDAWKRTFIFGIILGFLLPFSILITNEFIRQHISIAIIFALAWIVFRNYPFTKEDHE